MARIMVKGEPNEAATLQPSSGVAVRSEQASLCRNCGADATSKFCPECGQSTRIGIPRLFDLIHEGFGAFFSYDAKVWRTLVVLVSQPGQLTLDYIEGRRARYLTPFQLFFWLEAIAFLSHRVFFSGNPAEIDIKTKALLIVGAVVVLGLAALNCRKNLRFVAHLIAGTHIWSFLMLLLLAEYTIVPGAARLLAAGHIIDPKLDIGRSLTLIAQGAMVVYMVFATRRIYGLSFLLAICQTALLFLLYKGVAILIDRNWT